MLEQLEEYLSIDNLQTLSLEEYKKLINKCVEYVLDYLSKQDDINSIYYNLINITGIDIDDPTKSKLLSTIINSSEKIREIIWKKSFEEISITLKESIKLDNPILIDLFRRQILGKNFVTKGIGYDHDWNGFIKQIEPYIKKEIENIEYDKLIFWSGIDLTEIDPSIRHIENTTIGNKMYFLDLVYSNWNGEVSNLPKLQDLWSELSSLYTRLVLERLAKDNIKVINFYGKVDDTLPNQEAFGEIFLKDELGILLENGIRQMEFYPVNSKNPITYSLDISSLAALRIQERKDMLNKILSERVRSKENGL